MNEFKGVLCDENVLIARCLKDQCEQWLCEPILDVGAGLGDIAAAAFPDKRAFLLDLNCEIEPRSLLHTFVQGDFVSTAQNLPRPNTVLLCHVMQYLDENLDEFRSAVEILAPRNVIIVTNNNDGSFGKLMKWAKCEFPDANPEEATVDLGTRYNLRKTFSIRATMRCPSFEMMANQIVVGILDMTATPEKLDKTAKKLKQLLRIPTMQINETVYFYERQN